MKASPSSSNSRSGFSSDKRLALYGVAAGAALAAGTASARADLVTLDLTGLPTADRTSFFVGFAGPNSLYFDVNATSAAAAVAHSSFVGADFNIHNKALANSASSYFRTARLTGYSNGIAISIAFDPNSPRPFTTSNVVSPAGSGYFAGQVPLARTQDGVQTQGFAPGTTLYLGLKFLIGTDTHYGWVNLTVNDDFTETLNALGYESDPDTAAHVEPAANSASVPDQGNSLVLLAMGAAGLLAFRARQQKSA